MNKSEIFRQYVNVSDVLIGIQNLPQMPTPKTEKKLLSAIANLSNAKAQLRELHDAL